MKEKITEATFSLNGLSFAVGALGFLSGVVQLFVDINLQISIKWVLFVVWISLTLGMVLVKIVYDLHNEKRPSPPFERPIKYIADQQIFVIRRNDNFLNNIVVGCYSQQDEVDTHIGIGVVHFVQENVIQIKLVGKFIDHATAPTSQDALTRLVFRPVVPFEAFIQTQSTGN